MKEHDVVRMKEAFEDIPEGEQGTIVHVYASTPNVVEVEFYERADKRNEVVTIPVGKLEKA